MVRKFLALFICVVLLLCAIPLVQGAREVESGYISGYVLDSTGGPLRGVTILAVNSSSGESITTISNDTGSYRLHLPEGRYNISASLANYSADRSYLNLEVPDNITEPLNFTMTEVLCTVSGFVSAGTSVTGVTVTIFNSEFNYSVQTSAPGSFIIRNIQPGDYVAVAEKMGFNPSIFNDTLKINRGESLVINFSLEIQAAQIVGKVRSESGGGLANANVILKSADAGANSQGLIAITNEIGEYFFPILAAGNYTITFMKDGYQSNTRDVVLNPYQNLTLDSVLTITKKNATAVLFGYDLAHSFMIVAFITGFIVVVAGIFIHIRAQRKPDLLVALQEDEVKPPQD